MDSKTNNHKEMKVTTSEDNTPNITTDFQTDNATDSNSAVPIEAAADSVDATSTARPMKKARFLAGMCVSGCGIGLMLVVALGALHGLGVQGRLSMPIVGLCMILGLMLLGGGFGIMATSAATFDDDEFERLMKGEVQSRQSSEDTAYPQSSPPTLRKDPNPIARTGRQNPERLQNS